MLVTIPSFWLSDSSSKHRTQLTVRGHRQAHRPVNWLFLCWGKSQVAKADARIWWVMVLTGVWFTFTHQSVEAPLWWCSRKFKRENSNQSIHRWYSLFSKHTLVLIHFFNMFQACFTHQIKEDNSLMLSRQPPSYIPSPPSLGYTLANGQGKSKGCCEILFLLSFSYFNLTLGSYGDINLIHSLSPCFYHPDVLPTILLKGNQKFLWQNHKN